LLGYCFNEKNSKLKRTLRQAQLTRKQDIKKIVKKLQKLGFLISNKQVFKYRADYLGLHHIVKALRSKKKNLKKIRREVGKLGVFDIVNSYLEFGRPAYIKERLMPTVKMIKLIKKAGGITALAHPGFHLSFSDDDIIKKLKSQGLDALEVFTPKHNWEQIEHYEILAKKLGLVITAGSDYHYDTHKAHIPLGNPVGVLNLPTSLRSDFINFLNKKTGCKTKI